MSNEKYRMSNVEKLKPFVRARVPLPSGVTQVIFGKVIPDHFDILMIQTLQDSLVGKCTVDSKDNKEDKTREEADMTLTPVFPKSSKVVPMCPKVSQSGPNPYFEYF